MINIKYNPVSSSDQISLECSDGSKLNADHVIFTGSLGVLKKYHETLFTPNLPQNKVVAIEKNGFGCVGKIFLEFDVPFWPTDKKLFVAYAFLWTDEQRAEIKATNRHWLLAITGFFKVDRYPNLLEGFLGGNDEIRLFENLTDEKLIEDTMWFLEKFVGKTLPKPKLMKRTKWLSNDNFLGAYSYTSMDAEKFGVSSISLAKSINNNENSPIIIFAGEHTDFVFPSYANGAVNSGIRAANEIISHYS